MSQVEDFDPSQNAFPARAALTRLVWDFRAGRSLRGRGVAVWTPHGDGQTRQMRETIRFDGREASRETFWRWTGAGALAIDYADGAPLVTVPRPFLRSEAQHHCAPDLYRVRLSWGARIMLGWRVTGPAKDYAMVTVYTPEEEDDPLEEYARKA